MLRVKFEPVNSVLLDDTNSTNVENQGLWIEQGRREEENVPYSRREGDTIHQVPRKSANHMLRMRHPSLTPLLKSCIGKYRTTKQLVSREISRLS